MSELNKENKPELEAGNNEAAPGAEESGKSGKKRREKVQAEIQNGNPAERKRRVNIRGLKHGTMSVVLTVLFIAGVVVLNVIVGIISDRVDTTADLTDTGIYTLDEATVEYLGKQSMDVTLSVLNSETSFEGGGTHYKSVNQLLRKMEMENGHFKLQYLQIDQNPDFTSKFKGETLRENYIVVESEETGRHRILTPADYFSTPSLRDSLSQYGFPQTYVEQYVEQYISNYGSQVIEGSNVEQAAISALLYVTNTDPVRVAFTEGFGEGDSSSLSALLDKNGYDVETVNLQSAEKIDSGIDYVIMFAPTMDYDNESITKLANFLDNGGAFGKNLLYFASSSQPYYQSDESNSLKNLSAFLAEWGIAVGDSIVMQTDASHTYGNMPFALIQDIQDTVYAGNTYGSSLFTYDAYVRPIIQLWENGAKGGVEQMALIKSFDGAYLRPLSAFAESDFDISSAESGKFIDALCAYKTHSTTQEITRVIAFGSEMFASSTFMGYQNANNQDFLINMFNYISGKTEGVTITTKSFSNVGFEVNQENANILAVVLCAVIPVAVIVLGVVIWVRRRHR